MGPKLPSCCCFRKHGMKVHIQSVLTRQVLEETKRLCNQVPGNALALGFSGGMDSVVLAEALLRIGLKPLCLHINHGWRAKASRADEEWVRVWCRARGLKLEVKRLGAGVKRTEGEARKARWSFFRKMADKHGFGNLCLAHHADDRVETFFLQLLRGAGPDGLAGLREQRQIEGLNVLRPLLSFTKKELKLLAREWKLDWREDASNRSPDYFRNRVRHQLLPYLKKLSGRDPLPLILRTVRVLEGENAYWESELARDWPAELPLLQLRERPVGWQRRALRLWLAGRGVTDADFEQIEQIRLMLERDKPSKTNLSKSRCCRRRSGVLFVE